MKKRALILGIAGQDGSYLSEHLIDQGYDVYGLVRRNSVPEHQDTRIGNLIDKNLIHTEYGDLLDVSSIERMLSLSKPDEIYNLAAQSHVRISFDVPQFTFQTNALGHLNLLESVRTICPKSRIYFAASSEMFGNSVDDDDFQRITTPMRPISPYGIAKFAAYSLTKTYRESYGLHAVNGILFNHESPRRGSNFVTMKVVKTAVEISKGLKDSLYLGNLDAYRDWGHSKDYTNCMIKILRHDEPKDWIISSMQTHSVRELCNYVFSRLNLDYKKFVKMDERYLRPNELKYLKGDSTPFREEFGWTPEYTFETLLDEMIDYWTEKLYE